MFKLGLLRHPPLQVILNLAAGSDEEKRTKALRYFLEIHQTKYMNYSPLDYRNVAFVPALKDDKPALANPTEVCWVLITILGSTYILIEGIQRPAVGDDGLPRRESHTCP